MPYPIRRDAVGKGRDVDERITLLERRLARATSNLPARLSATGQQVLDWDLASQPGFYWSASGAANAPTDAGSGPFAGIVTFSPSGIWIDDKVYVVQEVRRTIYALSLAWLRRIAVAPDGTVTVVEDWVQVNGGGGAGGEVAWGDVTGKPTTFPPSAHTHGLADVEIVSLGTGVDLDSLTSTKRYHQAANANAAAGSNYPAAYAGLLDVYAASSMVYQRYTTYNGSGSYERQKYQATWSAWRHITNTWQSIVDKPTTFPPSAHTHAWGEVTGKPDYFPIDSLTPMEATGSNDLNTLFATGFYYTQVGEAVNGPADTASDLNTLVIIQNGAAGDSGVLGILQLAWELDSSTKSVVRSWTRAAVPWTTNWGAWQRNDPSSVTPPNASTTVAGVVELATSAEAQGGTDSARAVTPAAMRADSTSSASPNRVIRRDSAGRAKVAAPSAADDIATKGYVDAAAGGGGSHTHSLSDITVIDLGSGANLDLLTSSGYYVHTGLIFSGNASGYPVNQRGFLEVIALGSSVAIQRYTLTHSVGIYSRTYRSGSWATWVKIVTESV